MLEKYVYSAVVTHAYDGDTIHAEVSLGFDLKVKETFRLARINAPEITGASRDRGILSRDFVREKILGKQVTIKTYKDGREKYGRYLADIFFFNDTTQKTICLNDLLVEVALAEYKEY